MLLIIATSPVSGQVSYHFDRSIPWPIEDVQDFIYEQIGVEPGEECAAYMLPWREFERRFGKGYRGWHLPDPCRLYFRDWSFLDAYSFRLSLLHELMHAEGVGHSLDEQSLMHATRKRAATLQPWDRFALWIARQRASGAVQTAGSD